MKPTLDPTPSNIWTQTVWIRLIVVAVIAFIIFVSKKLNIFSQCKTNWSGCYTSFLISRHPNFFLQLIGVILTILGMLTAIAARNKLAGNWSSTIDLKKGHELITTGIYSYVRHPIYLGIGLMGLGALFELQSIIFIFVYVILLIVYWFRIRTEEALMSKVFPKEYLKYKKKVKAVIPFMLI